MPYNPTLDTMKNILQEALSSPPVEAFAIAPSDGADLARYARALTCTTAGNVSIVPLRQSDETAVVIALVPGQWTFAPSRKVNATGTTAVGIVGGV